MRIISGTFKGRRILVPNKLPVRPTTDRAKEGLFNILANRFTFTEIRVLDLFSGTGSISFEFASRSVPEVTAVDQHRSCVQFIEQFATKLDLPIRVLQSDCLSFLTKTKGLAYDIIFADPPYAFTLAQLETLRIAIFEKEILLPGGLVVLEHNKQLSCETLPKFLESRKYGSSVFSFFGNSMH